MDNPFDLTQKYLEKYKDGNNPVGAEIALNLLIGEIEKTGTPSHQYDYGILGNPDDDGIKKVIEHLKVPSGAYVIQQTQIDDTYIVRVANTGLTASGLYSLQIESDTLEGALFGALRSFHTMMKNSRYA